MRAEAAATRTGSPPDFFLPLSGSAVTPSEYSPHILGTRSALRFVLSAPAGLNAKSIPFAMGAILPSEFPFLPAG